MLNLAVANIVVALRNILNMEFRGQVGVEFVGNVCRVILVGEFRVPVGDTGLLVEVNERMRSRVKSTILPRASFTVRFGSKFTTYCPYFSSKCV